MKTRKSDFYKVSKSYSKRYLQSAIPSMQRQLNRDIKEQRESLKKLINCCVTSKLCLLYCCDNKPIIIIIIDVFPNLVMYVHMYVARKKKL